MCWQQGAPHGPQTHGHLLIAHYSFIELEQDSCYGWTVNADPVQAQAHDTGRGEATVTGHIHTREGWNTTAPASPAG